MEVLNSMLLQNNEIIFNVVDTGEGIPDKIAKRIFHNTNPNTSVIGTGGLSTYYASRMATTIDANVGFSTSDNGSTFWVSIKDDETSVIVDESNV